MKDKIMAPRSTSPKESPKKKLMRKKFSRELTRNSFGVALGLARATLFNVHVLNVVVHL